MNAYECWKPIKHLVIGVLDDIVKARQVVAPGRFRSCCLVATWLTSNIQEPWSCRKEAQTLSFVCSSTLWTNVKCIDLATEIVESLMNSLLSFLRTLSFGTLKHHWVSQKKANVKETPGSAETNHRIPFRFQISVEKQSFAILPGIGIVPTFEDPCVFRQFILDQKQRGYM